MNVAHRLLAVFAIAGLLVAGLTLGSGLCWLLRLIGIGEDLRLALGTAGCLLIVFAGLRCLGRSVGLPAGRDGTQDRRIRRVGRGAFRLLGWLALATVSCHVLSRVMSPLEAVRIYGNDRAAPASPLAAPSQLRIATYNIAHGRGTATSNYRGGDPAVRERRLLNVARVLRSADLDVVVLNEVDFGCTWSGGVNQARIIAEAAGFPYRVEQRSFDLTLPMLRLRFGNAVLSKYPISQATLVDHPGLSWWETLVAGKKRAVLCTIDLAEKRSVRVLAVHLEHRSESVRVASAEGIASMQRASDLPLIAAGDFNSTPLDFPHATADSSGRSAISLLLEGGRFTTLPDKAPNEDQLTFSSTDPRSVIDWVLVSPPYRLVSLEVIPSRLSDHRPVIATVEMTGP